MLICLVSLSFCFILFGLKMFLAWIYGGVSCLYGDVGNGVCCRCESVGIFLVICGEKRSGYFKVLDNISEHYLSYCLLMYLLVSELYSYPFVKLE